MTSYSHFQPSGSGDIVGVVHIHVASKPAECLSASCKTIPETIVEHSYCPQEPVVWGGDRWDGTWDVFNNILEARIIQGVWLCIIAKWLRDQHQSILDLFKKYYITLSFDDTEMYILKLVLYKYIYIFLKDSNDWVKTWFKESDQVKKASEMSLPIYSVYIFLCICDK